MPARIQSLIYALGLGKQSDIATVASSFLRFRKLNMDIHTPHYGTENDAAEIGKGNEFISQVFPTAYDMSGRVEKFGSAEFMTYALAYGLGGVSYGAGTYTITPIDPATTLELPYFSLVQQLPEGGGEAVDEVYVGCAMEEVSVAFSYGPGRQSVRVNASYNGSGRVTIPSGITVPAVQSEHYMLSQSMAVTINGHDYVGDKTILSGTMGWKNNLNLNAGYFPGAGVVNSAAVRGRMEIGARVPTFQFTARLLRTSPEYAALIAQTTGTAVITFTFDGTHTVTFTWQKMSYQMVERTEADGIVAVTVTGAPQFDATNGILTVTAQCGIVGIAQ